MHMECNDQYSYSEMHLICVPLSDWGGGEEVQMHACTGSDLLLPIHTGLSFPTC